MTEIFLTAIEEVAHHLKSLHTEVVFVGGVIAPLLITDRAAFALRPTRDVDVVVEITTRRQYDALQEKLRALGFRHDTTPDAPLCRWYTPEDTMVDVMPLEENILGFTNRWYAYALQTAKRYPLPSGREINLISAPAFIATKLDAFNNRGNEDYYASHDLEDILSIVNGRVELHNEIKQASDEVRVYIAESFNVFLGNDDFLAALPGHLPYELAGRLDLLQRQFQAIGELVEPK